MLDCDLLIQRLQAKKLLQMKSIVKSFFLLKAKRLHDCVKGVRPNLDYHKSRELFEILKQKALLKQRVIEDN